MARITYRKTRRGETIDIRADKGEDLRNVVKEMAKPVDRAVLAASRCAYESEPCGDPRCARCGVKLQLTAETITDAEIRELRNTKRSTEHWNLCDRAIRNANAWDRAARSRCAEILNSGEGNANRRR